MVPRAPSIRFANHHNYDEYPLNGEDTNVLQHAHSLPQQPPTQGTLLALPLSPSSPCYPSICSSPYEGPVAQTLHHHRTFSDSTYLTRVTSETRHYGASSTTSVSPQGASPHSNAATTNAIHQAGYFCPYTTCVKVIGNPSDLKRHIKAKHEGIAYICTLCRRSFLREYNHNTCNGTKSVFEATPFQRNGWGCGLCLMYFNDFDKWVRHIVLHQQKENKQKTDWDLSLQLRSLLQNPEHAGTYAFLGSQIATMTWLEDDYEDVKQILESDRYRSPDQLQIVFDLALPFRTQSHDWPALNPSASTHAKAAHTTSLPFDATFGMSVGTMSAPQPNVSANSSSAPNNVGWEQRAMSPLRTENTLRGLDEAIAGGTGSPDTHDSSFSINESQTDSYSRYLGSHDDSLIFPMSDVGPRSHFDEAFREDYTAPD